jgi:hypothetical protein
MKTSSGETIDIMAFAPCGECRSMVSIYIGCRHWQGVGYRAGKPGRVAGRSPGALPAEQRIG